MRAYKIGMKLKIAAIEAGVTGTEIADKLGLAASTISRWLTGETPVPSRYVRRLAQMLKIAPEQVLPPDASQNIP